MTKETVERQGSSTQLVMNSQLCNNTWQSCCTTNAASYCNYTKKRGRRLHRQQVWSIYNEQRREMYEHAERYKEMVEEGWFSVLSSGDGTYTRWLSSASRSCARCGHFVWSLVRQAHLLIHVALMSRIGLSFRPAPCRTQRPARAQSACRVTESPRLTPQLGSNHTVPKAD